MSLILLIGQSLYFFLPAYLANLVPSLFSKVSFLKKPLWEKKLGKNKTWRGFLFGVLAGLLVFWLQKKLYSFNFFYQLSLIDYSDYSLWLGFLLALGALLGDAVESYFKRKKGIPPGASWKPWDQLDFVLGGLVLSWFIYVPEIKVTLIILILSPFLHLLSCRIGYWLKIKETKF